MLELSFMNYPYSRPLYFDHDYPLFVNDYPPHADWLLTGGWQGKGIMRGSILGINMKGMRYNGTKAGYNSMLSLKLTKLAKERGIFHKKLVYIPCRTNVFDNYHNATNEKIKNLMLDDLTSEMYYNSGGYGYGKAQGFIDFGYDLTEKRYFFVYAEKEGVSSLLTKIKQTGQVTMAGDRTGIIF